MRVRSAMHPQLEPNVVEAKMFVFVASKKPLESLGLVGSPLPRTMPFLNRTVWLTHLPVGDNLTGKPFSLTDQAQLRLLNATLSCDLCLQSHPRS